MHVAQEAAWWWRARHVSRHLEWHFPKLGAPFARNTGVPLAWRVERGSQRLLGSMAALGGSGSRLMFDFHPGGEMSPGYLLSS